MGQFVITRCDSTEMFNPAKVTLNEIAVLILMLVIRCRVVAIGAWRNNRLGTKLGNLLTQRVRVKGLVGHDSIRINVLQQRGRLRDVMSLPPGQDESSKIAQALDQCVNLGSQPTTGSPDRLRPFF